MGEWFKRIWGWLGSPYLFGLPRPPVAPPAPPAPPIVGANYLEDYHDHYKQFQAAFLEQMRRTPDAEYWGSASLRDIAVFGGKWSQTAYEPVSLERRIIWWTIEEPSYAEWEAANAHLPGLKRTWSGLADDSADPPQVAPVVLRGSTDDV